jgi:hypothetical protein
MYCPKCRAEFVEGITKCPDCEVDLVEDLPPEDEILYKDYATVYTTSDSGLIAIAESLLKSENITYAKKSEGLQAVYGIGFVQFQVPPKDKEKATELLKDLVESGDEISDDNIPEDDIDR